MPRTIKTGVLRRCYEVRKEDISREARTVGLTFSSEEPYDRWFGTEILDHGKKSVVLDRLNTGGPLLVDHDTRDQVGVVEEAKIGNDRRGRAVVRLGKSQRAEEVFRDITDGIRRNVSVGYRVHQMVLEKTEGENSELKTYRVTKWEPLELSIVAVPADNSVGVGRADDRDRDFDTEILEPELQTRADAAPEKIIKENVMTEPIVEKVVDLSIEKDKVRKEEQKRVREILAYGEKFNQKEAAKKAIEEGTGIDEFRMQVLEMLGKAKPVETSAEIGMSDKEIRQYRILDGINALANLKDQDIQRAAGLVFEASAAVSSKIKKQARGFFVPMEIQRRDLTVGTPTAGGNLVATNLLASSMIELLRNKMVVIQLGGWMLDGLIGSIAIPKQTGGATAYWVSESGAPTESQQTVGQVTLSPNTVGAFTDISRKLLLQSSIGVEAFVRSDLATVIAIELDRACINGSGTPPEPRGILNVSGIGAVAGGTNGKAPTWANMISLETEVAIDNADVGALNYLSNAKVRGKLKATQKVPTYGNDFVWQDDPQGRAGWGMVNGYRAAVTNQVPSTLTKGSASAICSAIIFGNFNDLIIGHWGALDILVDPYTGSTSGTVRVVALQDVDIAVRHAESFAAMKDALTT